MEHNKICAGETFLRQPNYYLPMSTVFESPEDKSKPNSPPLPPSDFPSKRESKALEQATPWINYAVEQALLYQKIIEQNINATIEASRSRLSEIRSISSAYFNQTISQLGVYEDIVFGKVKEGINIAASHPLITGGVAVGLEFLVPKRPRRSLYYKTLCLFESEERSASVAEEELIRGRTKLSTYVAEKTPMFSVASGLKDILGELPRREASRFRLQVSNIASEAKRERNALAEDVLKISNYGIAV
ncbi:hypothetical protein CRYUN_Cryun01aG0246500 [Craigia yunnanensis]